jgi:hypothetical protein
MVRSVAVAILALGLVSCGSSSGSGSDNGSIGSCGKVEPCGGSVVGSWNASATCLDQTTVNMSFQSGLMGACPTATATATTGTAIGTMMLNADLTYSTALVAPFEISIALPADCTGGMTCAEFAVGVTQALNDGTVVTCTGSGSCSCTMSTDATLSSSGTYTASGTVLAFSGANGYANSGTYCVQGDTLHLVDVDATMNMGPMGQATIKDDVTLTKQ